MCFIQKEYNGFVYQMELKFQVTKYYHSLPKFLFHLVPSPWSLNLFQSIYLLYADKFSNYKARKKGWGKSVGQRSK